MHIRTLVHSLYTLDISQISWSTFPYRFLFFNQINHVARIISLVNMIKMAVLTMGIKNKMAQNRKKNIVQIQAITDIQNFTSICMCWRVACTMELVLKNAPY